MKNFRELYCTRYGIRPEQYETHIIWRSLHWRGRVLFGVPGLRRTFYKPDYEYVRGVGELRSRRGFHDESTEFHYHPGNRGFFRRVFLMRVSSRACRRSSSARSAIRSQPRRSEPGSFGRLPPANRRRQSLRRCPLAIPTDNRLVTY